MTRKSMFLLATIFVLMLVLAGCGGNSDDGDSDMAVPAQSSGDAANGEQLFQVTCSPCHGPDGKGVEGLGKDFTASEFVKGLSDQELLAFVKEGRPFDDPDNTTGVEMPASGGNPALTDQQLLDIIAHIRTLK